jgi:cytochrome bd-type quinol oxidase subunit 2
MLYTCVKESYIFAGFCLPLILMLLVITFMSYRKNSADKTNKLKMLLVLSVSVYLVYLLIGWLSENNYPVIAALLTTLPILLYIYAGYAYTLNPPCGNSVNSVISECFKKL